MRNHCLTLPKPPCKGPSDIHTWCTKNNKQLEQTNKQKNTVESEKVDGEKELTHTQDQAAVTYQGFSASTACYLACLCFVYLFVTTEDLKNFFLKPHYSAQIMQFHLTFKFQ